MAATTEEDEGLVELEGLRKEDHSWHPCHVSLSSGDSAILLLDFGNCESENIISSEAEALQRLRVRSIPLQNGDCLDIKEEEHVLAMHNTQYRNLFLDAEVEKAWRVRHSNRVHCRCSFEIKWLHPDLKGQTVKVPSTSIWKLSRNSIHSHPTVGIFLKSVNPSKNSDMPSCVTPLKDTNCELDLECLLDNQIEEISKFVNAFDKAGLREISVGVKGVEFGEPTEGGAFVTSKIGYLHNHSPYNQNSFRRSTRSQRKLQLEMEHKVPPPLSEPVPEEHSERSYLSPLAARAALASLVHNLPQKQGISVRLSDKWMLVESDVCIQEKISTRCEGSSAAVMPKFPVVSDPIQITDNDESVEIISEKSPVSSKRGASQKNQLMEGSLKALPLTMQEKAMPDAKFLEKRSLNSPTTVRRLTNSIKGRKLNSSTITKRLTRSAMQKVVGNAIDEVQMVSITKDGNPKVSTILTRLTCSTDEEEMGNSIDQVKRNFSTNDGKLNGNMIELGLKHSGILSETGNLIDEVSVESLNKDRRSNRDAIAPRLTRSAIRREMENPNNGVGSSTRDGKSNGANINIRSTPMTVQKEMETSAGSPSIEKKLDNHNIITRLTHSAINNEMGNSINTVELSSSNHKKLNKPAKMIRLTRSAIQAKISSTKWKELESSVEDMKQKLTSVQKESESFADSTEVESLADQRKSKSPTNATRSARSTCQKEKVNSAEEVQQHSSTNKKLNTPIAPRLTRSVFLRETENLTTKSEKKQEKRKGSQDVADVSLDVDIPMNKENKKMKSSSTIESKTIASQLWEGRKASGKNLVKTTD